MIKILFCLLLWPAWGLSQNTIETETKRPDYFSPPSILKFADHLYQSGDYLRAAGEYQRYLFVENGNKRTDSVYYRMVKALYRGRDYDRCLTLLDDFRTKYRNSPLADNVPLYEAVILMTQHKYIESREKVDGAVVSENGLKNKILAAGYLYTRQYSRAREVACAAEAPVIELCEKLKNSESLPFKSKFLAGTLSTIIPGLGKIYCRRTADGIYSLILVGLSTWQAYDGFKDDGSESVKGWIFSGIGTAFYIGNIYGSVIAAEVYNCKVHNDYVQGLQISITLP